MPTQFIFENIIGALKSYILASIVVMLVFLQLFLTTHFLQLDSLLPLANKLSLLAGQPSLLTITFFCGFIACCGIWYFYRPVVRCYFAIKNSMLSWNPASLFCVTINSSQIHKNTSSYDWVSRIARRLARKLSIKAPAIMISPSLEINAKVLPGLFHAPLIILTQGLLNKLTADEIEAVLAHELAHVAKYDTYTISVLDLLLTCVLWAPVYLGHIFIDYILLFKWRDKNIGFILCLFVAMISYGLLALLILNAINRRYELRADQLAMTLVNTQSFVNALHRIHSSEQSIPGALEWLIEFMPAFAQRFILRLFLSHPPIPVRIAALR